MLRRAGPSEISLRTLSSSSARWPGALRSSLWWWERRRGNFSKHRRFSAGIAGRVCGVIGVVFTASKLAACTRSTQCGPLDHVHGGRRWPQVDRHVVRLCPGGHSSLSPMFDVGWRLDDVGCWIGRRSIEVAERVDGRVGVRAIEKSRPMP